MNIRFLLYLRFFIYRIVLICNQLALLLLLETVIFLLVPAIYSLHPLFAGYKDLFLAILTLLQIPAFFYAVHSYRRSPGRSFSGFVFHWEKHNFTNLQNQASAYLSKPSSSNPVESHFRDSLEDSIGKNLSKTRFFSLLPLSNILIALIMALGLSGYPGWKVLEQSRILRSLSSILERKGPHLEFSFPDLQNAYLKNIPIQIHGRLKGKPIFPVALRIKGLDGSLEQEVPVTDLRLESSSISPPQFRFEVALNGFSQDRLLSAVSGSEISSDVILRFVDFPKISSQKIQIRPPEYTGQPMRTFPRIPFSVLEKSWIEQKIRFNKSMKAVWINPKGTGMKIEVLKDSITLSGVLSSTLRYSLNFRDQDGFEDQTSSFTWKTYADQEPKITVLKPPLRQPIKKGTLESLNLELKAEDDQEITRLRLDYLSKQRFEMSYISSRGSLELSSPNQALVLLKKTIEIPSLYLQEGDSLSFRVLAWDNFPGRSPSFSTTHSLWVPYFYEKHAEALQKTQDIISDFEEVMEDEKRVEAQIKNLKESIEAAPDTHVNVQEQEKLKQITQVRQDIQKMAEELEKKVDKALDTDRENSLLDEGTLMKMQQVQELYQEILREMSVQTAGLESMASQSKSLDPDRLQNMVQEFDKQKFSEELDRALDSLKKIETRQKFKKSIEKIGRLSKEHEKLDQLLMQGSKPPPETITKLKKEWEKLARELEELKQDPMLDSGLKKALDKNLKKAKKQLDSEYEKLEEAAKEEKSEPMRKANRSLQKSLKDFKEAMQESLDQNTQQAMRISLDKLNGFLRETFYQAGFLQELEHELQFLKPFDKKRYSAQELSFLASATRSLKERIAKEYQANLSFQKTVVQVARHLLEKTRSSIRAYASDRPPKRAEPIRGLYRTNNQLSLILLNLREQLEKQRQESSSSQFMQSLEQLTQAQQKINQGTRKMSSQEAAYRQQMMEKLAFQQSLVRQSTEKLYSRFKEKLSLARGLKTIAAEMRAVEKALSEGKAGEQTKRKQDKIEYQLLEAQKALKEQKEGKTRRGKTAKGQNLQKGLRKAPETAIAPVIPTEILSRQEVPKNWRVLIENYFDALKPNQ
jgi:hypothetical protein